MSDGATPAKPKRKFVRPAWAKPQSTQSSQTPKPTPKPDEDLFNKSSHSYEQIVKEKEEKRLRELARKEKAKEEKRTPKTEGYEWQPRKKRRVSTEAEDAELDDTRRKSGDESEERHVGGTAKGKATPKGAASGSSRSPIKSRPQKQSPKAQAVVIDLGDSDGDDSDSDYAATKSTSKRDRLPMSPVTPEEPTYEAHNTSASPSVTKLADIKSSPPELATPPPAPITRLPTPPTPLPDAVLSILITSPIPDTKPLIVQRKLSQRLQEIRTAWCQRQPFGQDVADTVFLTWKNRKLFDSTTCRSLGIKADEDGRVTIPGEDNILSDGMNRVHMVAVTPDLFEELKRDKERKMRRILAKEQDEEEDRQEEERKKKEKEKQQIRIILKAKGYENYKLIVRPTTTFSKIAMAFRKERQVSDDKEVFLMFDDERLDPDEVMSSTDIADLDMIDVHISTTS